MGTVVYFVEFIMMSLMGIMLYKLYTSYESWKNTSVFASSNDPLISSKSISNTLPDNDDSALPILAKPSVEIARTLLTKPIMNEHLLGAATTQEKNNHTIVIEEPKTEKNSSAILNDYIGEFFLENQIMDINPYRSLESKNNIPSYKVTSVLGEEKSEDEFIKVETLAVVSVTKTQTTDVKTVNSLKDFLPKDDTIPTLVELSEPDPDSFIIVSAANNEVKDSHKVMSDKVVLAMLDEARLVCAS